MPAICCRPTLEQKKQQTLATAFLRVGKRTTENGAIDEEYRVEYGVDRTNTIGTAFLGMTVGCARCHDHKYDPISQKDFYSLFGFFNSTDEPGFYAPGRTGITPGPTLPWTDAATEAKIAALAAVVREREGAYQAALATAKGDARLQAQDLIRNADAANAVRASLQKALVAHYPFEQTESYQTRSCRNQNRGIAVRRRRRLRLKPWRDLRSAHRPRQRVSPRPHFPRSRHLRGRQMRLVDLGAHRIGIRQALVGAAVTPLARMDGLWN